MFLGLLLLGLILTFIYLWGDYMKVLIFLEIVRLILLSVFLFIMKIDYFSINYFFILLIFLVCESRIGFLLFIFYIRIEGEMVKKLILTQL